MLKHRALESSDYKEVVLAQRGHLITVALFTAKASGLGRTERESSQGHTSQEQFFTKRSPVVRKHYLQSANLKRYRRKREELRQRAAKVEIVKPFIIQQGSFEVKLKTC